MNPRCPFCREPMTRAGAEGAHELEQCVGSVPATRWACTCARQVMRFIPAVRTSPVFDLTPQRSQA